MLADSWLTARQILTVADASVCLMISESIQPRAGNASKNDASSY